MRDIGKKYFTPENQLIVVMGDQAAVGEQLKAFGDFVITDKQVVAATTETPAFAPALFV